MCVAISFLKYGNRSIHEWREARPRHDDRAQKNSGQGHRYTLAVLPGDDLSDLARNLTERFDGRDVGEAVRGHRFR